MTRQIDGQDAPGFGRWDNGAMSYEWPTEDWLKAVEAIKAKYPGIAAAAALAVLAEAGWTLTPPEQFEGPVAALEYLAERSQEDLRAAGSGSGDADTASGQRGGAHPVSAPQTGDRIDGAGSPEGRT